MYINLTTNQQVSEQEIRAAFPNTSFPSLFMPPEGYALVFPAPQPAHNPVIQTVREIVPQQTTLGHYEQRWEVVELFSMQSEKDTAIAANTEATRKANIPQSVTMRQARLALLAAGKLSSVIPAIDTLPEPQKSEALIEWEFSGTVERNRPFVLLLGGAIGLSELALDQLFTNAALL